jgi:hypothetical protein
MGTIRETFAFENAHRGTATTRGSFIYDEEKEAPFGQMLIEAATQQGYTPDDYSWDSL